MVVMKRKVLSVLAAGAVSVSLLTGMNVGAETVYETNENEAVSVVKPQIADSLDISEETKLHFCSLETYLDEKGKTKERIVENFKSIKILYNIPIRYAFTEYKNLDDVLASAYGRMYYVVEGVDGAVKFYDMGFNEMKSNSSTVIDGKETPLPFITIPESVTDSLSDPDFAKKYISLDAKIKNVYLLSGENSKMGTALCYRTNVGDYIYYCHHDIGEKLFTFEDFRKYQQAVSDYIAKYSDLDGSADIDISKVWDLSKYELKEVGEKSEQQRALDELAKKEISDIGEYRRERAVITGALSADAPRITLKQVNEIINASSSLTEIYDKINKAQPYPDFYGGSGISMAEYWLDDEGTERVVIIIEDNVILYHRYGDDGKLAEWKELYSNKNGASSSNGEPAAVKGEDKPSLISDHEAIAAMLKDFIKENNLPSAIVFDDEPSGTVTISYYYVHSEQKEMFENFIKDNNIDADKVYYLVMEGAMENPKDNEISTLKGDVDLNGRVDLADLTTLAKYILSSASYPLANETAYANADMNDDGKVDGIDMSVLIEQQLGK